MGSSPSGRLLPGLLFLGALWLGASPAFSHVAGGGPPAAGDAPSPAGSPAQASADAAAPDADSSLAPYYFLPGSRLEVLTRRSGFLSFLLGEDHRIRAGSFDGLVDYDPGLPRQAVVDVRVPVDSLVVLTPTDSSDRAEIRRRMLAEVLRSSEFPEIVFRSSKVEPVAGTLLVEGSLSMAGVSRHVVVGMTTQLRADTLLAQGRFSVRLSDYEMERPGVAWGTVKVADQVDIDLYVRALRGPLAFPGGTTAPPPP